MIEILQLKQLITISECGTISKAADYLFLSQPSLSRSMQKLEENLGVSLFSRQKNKIELNENGKLAVEYSKKLVGDFNEYVEKIRAFDLSKRTISVGSCAPAPLWKLIPALSAFLPQKNVLSGLADTQALLTGLENQKYNIIITTENVCLPNCISKEFCREKLKLFVPEGHKLANRESVTFADIDGITMLLYNQIGSWKKVKDYMPNTRFIEQIDMNSFEELIKESDLPAFTTDLALAYYEHPKGRVSIPIRDETAIEIFYISVLENNKKLIADF